MSPLEHNKQVAIRMIQQLSKGVLDESLITEDVHWWIPGRGQIGKADFLELVAAFQGLVRQGEGRIDIRGITAEGDRVAVEAESFMPLINGSLYNNTYHFLFEFENGRIRRAKEYNDSRYAAKTLGAIRLPAGR